MTKARDQENFMLFPISRAPIQTNWFIFYQNNKSSTYHIMRAVPETSHQICIEIYSIHDVILAESVKKGVFHDHYEYWHSLQVCAGSPEKKKKAC